MLESQLNAAKPLCDEILAQARREAGEIARRARDQAQAIIDSARAKANQSREGRLRSAYAEASRRTELILAALPIERARLEAVRRETLLESIHQELRDRLTTRQGFDYEQTVVNLVVSAISQMADNAYTIRLSATDFSAFGPKVREVVERQLPRPITVTISEDATITGGALIQSDHQLWDNQLHARLERLWPQLRQQIAVATGLLQSHE